MVEILKSRGPVLVDFFFFGENCVMHAKCHTDAVMDVSVSSWG